MKRIVMKPVKINVVNREECDEFCQFFNSFAEPPGWCMIDDCFLKIDVCNGKLHYLRTDNCKKGECHENNN